MNNLSPAAQAVLDAFWSGKGCIDGDDISKHVAAALRTVADQAQASVHHTSPSTDWGKGWKEGVRDVAEGLLAIAIELDGTNNSNENVLDHG